MNRSEIESIKIESRCCGKLWNITMFVKPKGKDDCIRHSALVDAAEDIVRDAMNLQLAWVPRNAEVMIWSAHPDSNMDALGMHKPHMYRVTLDMCRDKDLDKEEVQSEQEG